MDIIIILAISVSAPVVGSLIGVLKKPSEGFMYNMLSFAAGIMLAISFLELIPESIEFSSIWICMLGLIIGALVMYAVDKFIPHIHPEACSQEQGDDLKKTAIYLIIGMMIHNFPEGMAIAIGSVSEIKVSYIIALAIAIHDIPEGICTSAPYYMCTQNRLKSFLVSSMTALPVVIGYFTAYYLFKNISLELVGLIVGATAGLMIYISADELIPTSSRKNTNHQTIFTLIAGVLFVILLQTI